MQAFTGITVVEMTQGIAGPLAGMFLADMGARVIKVEQPQGDWARALPGFQTWNRNKESVVLSDHDQQLLSTLLSRADVLLLDGEEGISQRWSEGQVVCCITQSPAQAFRNLPADRRLAEALAGVMAITPSHRGGPIWPVAPYLAYGTGLLAAAATAAALFVRARTGRGQAVEIPSVAAGGYLTALLLGEFSNIPRLERGSSVGVANYRASDGWLNLYCPTASFVSLLFTAIGRPELVSDPLLALSPYFTPEGAEALRQIIGEAIASKRRHEWVETFAQYGVPCGPVLEREEFLQMDAVHDNEMLITTEHPELGPLRQMGFPLKMKGETWLPPRPAPRLGQDTEAVRKELSTPGQVRRRSSPLPQHPLEGVRVLDLSMILAMPSCGRLLAELGADVIKIEHPEGESLRPNTRACLSINGGKRAITVHIQREAGRQLLQRLVRTADVVIHSFRPRTEQHLGLDYESLRALEPDLIYAFLTGFGEYKPWQGRPAFDGVLQALSGQMAVQAGEEEPVEDGNHVNDMFASFSLLLGIISALYRRELTGKGAAMFTCLLNAAVLAQCGEVVSYQGSPPGPKGSLSRLGDSATYRLFNLADGTWAVLAIHDEESWQRFNGQLNSRVHLEYPWPRAREEAVEGELGRTLEKIFAHITREELVERLCQRGIPCAPVIDPVLEGLDNPIFAQGGQVDGDVHPLFGRMRLLGNGMRFSRTPARPPKLSPWIGENNDEILRELGYSGREIRQLEADGVIAWPSFKLALP